MSKIIYLFIYKFAFLWGILLKSIIFHIRKLCKHYICSVISSKIINHYWWTTRTCAPVVLSFLSWQIKPSVEILGTKWNLPGVNCIYQHTNIWKWSSVRYLFTKAEHFGGSSNTSIFTQCSVNCCQLSVLLRYKREQTGIFNDAWKPVYF